MVQSAGLENRFLHGSTGSNPVLGVFRMIKAIIFDMGGVVLNAKIESGYALLAEKLNIKKEKFDEVKNRYIKDAQIGKISSDELLSKISEELNLDKKKLREYWEHAYLEVMLLDSEVIELVKKLKEKGYLVSMISNTIEIHSQLNRKRRVYEEFNPVVLSNEVGLIKPSEEIYKLMLDKIKLRASECVFIDDREEHLFPARKLGMHSILFKNIEQLKKELKGFGIKF